MPSAHPSDAAASEPQPGTLSEPASTPAPNAPQTQAASAPVPLHRQADAQVPTRAHHDDAGSDLYSSENVTIAPGQRAAVGTGVSIALPVGTVGLVCPRSGLAARHGLTVLNGPGIVDAGYRGEIKVVLLNTDQHEPMTIARGDRIAQLVLVPYLAPEWREEETLPDTDRAHAGFGSTGGFTAPPQSDAGAHGAGAYDPDATSLREN